MALNPHIKKGSTKLGLNLTLTVGTPNTLKIECAKCHVEIPNDGILVYLAPTGGLGVDLWYATGSTASMTPLTSPYVLPADDVEHTYTLSLTSGTQSASKPLKIRVKTQTGTGGCAKPPVVQATGRPRSGRGGSDR